MMSLKIACIANCFDQVKLIHAISKYPETHYNPWAMVIRPKE